jgi:ubiquinone/menaquinone biosynthesis C-methylase UbiE
VRRPEFIARQSRRPSGVLGWIIGHIMSFETAATNDKALALLELKEGERVLDVGCGHGRTVERAAGMVGDDGLVVGMDASEEMLRMATRRCQRLIDAGRVRLTLGDSASTPYPDESFDKVVTVHTLYFWDDPRRHLHELHRVLRPGGRLVGAFHPKGAPATTSFPASVYSFYDVEEVGALLRATGFQDVAFAGSVGEVTLALARARRS